MADNFVPLRKQPKQKSVHLKPNQIPLSADVIRSRHGIEVDGENIPDPIENFEKLDVPQRLKQFLKQTKKLLKPTPVQMQSIGCLQESRDVICLSATGTGKTYSYLLPLCTFLWKHKHLLSSYHHGNGPPSCKPLCLVVVPTRELMHQVLVVARELITAADILQPSHSHEEGSAVNKHFNVTPNQTIGMYQGQYHGHRQPQWSHPQQWVGPPYHHHPPYQPHFPLPPPQRVVGETNASLTEKVVLGVCGGVPVREDVEKLKWNPKVMIATPGRLLDLCDKGMLELSNTNYFVIDECDKILEMGMEQQLRKIVAMVTVNSNNSNESLLRTSLWSATLPESLERIARSAVVDPVYVCCGVKNHVPRNIHQEVQFLHTYQKREYLLDVLRRIPYPPVIVFASSKEKVDRITQLLQDEQFHAAALHSGYPQSHRNNVLDSFRNLELDILVATDLASRGLDVPTVTHIINFDTPDTIEDYIHRVGRTGRFGREGHVTTLLTLDCKIAAELKELLEASPHNSIPLQMRDLKMFGRNVMFTEMGDRVC